MQAAMPTRIRLQITCAAAPPTTYNGQPTEFGLQDKQQTLYPGTLLPDGALLGALLDLARGQFPAVALSVRASNPARRLYERHGFVVVDTITNRVGGQSFVMQADLRTTDHGRPTTDDR